MKLKNLGQRMEFHSILSKTASITNLSQKAPLKKHLLRGEENIHQLKRKLDDLWKMYSFCSQFEWLLKIGRPNVNVFNVVAGDL